jgi:hypothetical protein
MLQKWDNTQFDRVLANIYNTRIQTYFFEKIDLKLAQGSCSLEFVLQYKE